MNEETIQTEIQEVNEFSIENLKLEIQTYAHTDIIEAREEIETKVLNIISNLPFEERIAIREEITKKWQEASWKIKMRFYNLSAWIFNLSIA